VGADERDWSGCVGGGDGSCFSAGINTDTSVTATGISLEGATRIQLMDTRAHRSGEPSLKEFLSHAHFSSDRDHRRGRRNWFHPGRSAAAH
jgi:hypothetical protein